ncbi:MAG: archease [Candidatus Omnitrophota bacterium]
MKKNTKSFEFFEHTADIGLKIYGKDPKEIFVNAAKGLFSLITDLKKVDLNTEIEVKLKDENREELLVSWLNELIFQFSTYSFISKEFKIEEITDNKIKAKVLGEEINLSKHKILSEIKAATYHELEIKETDRGFEARVIFDT